MPRIRAIALLLLLMAFVGPARAGWDEGVAAFRNGDLVRAVAEFRAVVDAQPAFSGGHFMLAQALSNQGGRAEALAHFRRAYELEPGNVSYQFALARAYLANGRAAEAVRMLERINPNALPSSQRAEYQRMLEQAGSRAGFSYGGSARDGAPDPRIAEQNRRIAEENAEIERRNAEIEAMRREAEALEQAMRELEEGGGGRL